MNVRTLIDGLTRGHSGGASTWAPPSAVPGAVFEPKLQRLDGLAPTPRASIHGKLIDLTSPVDWGARAWGASTREARAALHGMEFLGGLDDRWFELVVRDWLAAHPLPGKHGPDMAWDTGAISVRCVTWMQELATRAPRLAGGFSAEVQRAVLAQLDWLERGVDPKPGRSSRLVKAKALLWGAASFEGPRAERWRRRGEDLLSEELSLQVLPDGAHVSGSPTAHAQALTDLVECLAVVRDVWLMARIEAALLGMGQALVDWMHPDGRLSPFQGAGAGWAYDASECLDALEQLTGVRPVPRASFALEDAGYFGVRGEESYLLARVGGGELEAGSAWPEADWLSFEWSLRGQRLIVDPGVYELADSEWSRWARSTSAHNTVTLDGADQFALDGHRSRRRKARGHVERWGRAGSSQVFEAWHDGFAGLRGRPVHYRRIVVGPHTVQVEDNVQGGAGQKVEARLLLHPDVALRQRGKLLLMSCGEAVAALETDHEVTVENAWHFPSLGYKQRTRQIVVHYREAPCSGSFLLQASRPEFSWTAFLRRAQG
jgi:uncharacterized heparinase superfamily protein